MLLSKSARPTTPEGRRHLVGARKKRGRASWREMGEGKSDGEASAVDWSGRMAARGTPFRDSGKE